MIELYLLRDRERNGLGNIVTITYDRWWHSPIIGGTNHL